MYIKSTRTSPAKVNVFAPLVEGRQTQKVIKSVILNGGANVQDKRTLIAPDGIIQEIDDADWEAIKDTPWMVRQIKAGYIVPYGKSKPRKTFTDMEAKDKSAQLTEADYKKRGKKAPKSVSGSAE